MLFGKQASKDSTECDITNRLPRIDIVSDRLLSLYALHQILQVSHPPLHQQQTEADLSHTNRHCLADPKKKSHCWVMY